MRPTPLAFTVVAALATGLFVPAIQAQFTSADIGNPAVAGSSVPAGNGYAVTGGGLDIYGTGDQFHFNYEQRTGDFDVKLRVQSYSASSVWAKAGLMARETLGTNSRHASVFATPSLSGTFFSWRSTSPGGTTNIGSFPVGYPSTWLRLKRAGTAFTGYASLDGQAWAQLGSVTLTSPSNTLYVGMAVTSASATEAATAEVRDLADVVGGTIGGVTLPFEPPGPSSRNTGLVISEIMYHPKPTNDLEFIEILNAGLIEEDLSGYRISGDVDYTFPAGTVLRTGARLVVARYPSVIQATYGISGVLGPWTGNGAAAPTNALPDDAGTVRLRNRANAVLLTVDYEGANPWPIAADGAGHSLVLARPSYGEADPRAWAASDQIGGSPGGAEPVTPEPARTVIINEFLAHTDEPLFDYIELYNAGNQAVNISGLHLSDDRDTNKFRIPDGTTLPARGFISFNQNQLGFSLSSGGERIYLVNSNQTRVLDVVTFDAQANGVASGRYPDGAPGFHELATRTPGAANSPLLIRDIVINEIMFNPISGKDADEYVELYNRGASPVNLSNWRFTSGISFRFPTNTVIPANGYLVIAKDHTNLLANYPQLNAGNTLGDFGGALANGGERLALAMPDYFLVTNNNVVSTQANYVVVDEVAYADSGRWSRWADGGGSSLELIDPNTDHRLMANWADSDETAKSAWTTISNTGLLDNIYPVNGAGATANEIQVMILGAGEALMDDVLVQTGSSGANLVLNPTFDTGVTSWLIQGNHVRSTIEPIGPNNPSPSLHIRATAGGDNGANRVECDLSATVANNTTATIGARFRWLRGFPIVLMRLHGGALEAVGTLPLPKNLGTPGQPNSRRQTNAGPAIYDVTHSPILPAANEPVVITARVSDPDGIASVELRYRLDPGTTVNTLAMRDDGTGGDAIAADGVYTATVPGQPVGTNAFRVVATDSLGGSPASSTFPATDLGEALVRWGEPSIAGNLGVYRIWMTASNINLWTTRERLSNQAIDGTMVYGNFRAIYNAGARYRGSAFTRNPASPNGVGVAANYVWTLPDDEFLLGTDELNLDCLEPANSSNVRDVTALREVTSFTMLEQLDLPFSYQRYVHVVINGVTSTARNIPVYTDSQQPNGEYTAMWFPEDNDGDLFKIDDWFEFSDPIVGTDGTGMQGNKSASLEVFTTPSASGPVKKQARYRWSWEKKFNRGLNDDYSSLYAAVDALNSPEPTYLQQVNNEFEIREWLAALAFRHVVGDWDGYGYQRGKNQFCYRPRNGKFWMLMWDLDFSLGCNSGHAPTQDLFTLSQGGPNASDNMPEVGRLYSNPNTRRMYLQALQQLAEGPMQDANFLPTMDARYRALLANGVSALTSPYVGSGAQSISVPAWIQQRRGFILTNASNPNRISLYTNTPFRITSPLTVTTNDNRLAITGTGSLPIKDIILNGVAWPVTWNTLTSWTARVVLDAGTNSFRIEGTGLAGTIITSNQTVVAEYTGPVVPPQDAIVFSEIMYDPAVPDASFVELFNRSTSSFDIGGWRVNGLDYTFPTGTIITNGQYLVLVKNTSAYFSAFGSNALAFGRFDGNLALNGETLTLIQPGTTNTPDVIIDQVRYEPASPWPAAASNGASLQLTDALQDNSRVSNWESGLVWQRVTRTANIQTGTNVLLSLSQVGSTYIDDISLVGPDGNDILVNGGFEDATIEPWIVGSNYLNSVVVSGVSRSGNKSLLLQNTAVSSAFPHGYIQQVIAGSVQNNTNYTLTYYVLYNTNSVTVAVRTLPGSSFTTTIATSPLQASPGGPSLFASTLPPYDPLWLNEVQPNNTAGIADNFGQQEPWIELYNAGTTPIDLSGYYLATNYTSGLPGWPFPAGSSIAPGEFKIVWADGQPAQTSGTNLHTSFRLSPTSGTLALVRMVNSAPQITDYLNYPAAGPALSYGDYPDGQPFHRFVMFDVTPGATNKARNVNVFINEWLAANTNSIADPADNDYDDWFELYNAGTETVDLGGYFLTDDLGNRNKFMIPTNGHYKIPPGGFLLVWADGEPGQNDTNRVDLHADFSLRAAGESIGLFSADGIQIDAVTFLAQADDVSEGRYTDGAPAIYAMTTPTPRGPNVVGGGANNPPSINPIADRFISLGGTVSFTASGSDPDAGQTLTYSLAPGFPVGATIDATSGAFLWRPTQGPGLTSITVQATDNGVPPKTATESFTVTVASPPTVSISGNTVSLSFPTISGRTYRIEYKNDLNTLVWSPLITTVAAGSTLAATDMPGADQQRFYRIVQLD